MSDDLLPDPTAQPEPMEIPQRLQAITYQPSDPHRAQLVRIEAWTAGSDPMFFFLTPEQAIAWASHVRLRAEKALAWNSPAAGVM